MDKKFIKRLVRIMKKNPVANIFFFKMYIKVQQMFGIMKKATMKFSPKSEEKQFFTILFNYRGPRP